MKETLGAKAVMRCILIVGMLTLAVASSAQQMSIFRCGNEYANTTDDRTAKDLYARGCKRIASSTDPVSIGPDIITVKISPDRHFRISGAVNGVPVTFLVDTGASFVSIPDAIGKRAGLQGGRQALMRTANGTVERRIVRAVPITAGPFTVPEVDVSIGLPGSPFSEVLLGQSFLSNFEVTFDESEMTIRHWKK